MSFQYPVMIGVAIAVGIALGAGYRWLHLQRTKALAGSGLATAARGWRRHVPPVLFILALTILLLAVGRPAATIKVPRVAGTVVLAFDVSNSMLAADVSPTRLAAAQAAAKAFVEDQPDSVDIGVVAFDQGALTTHQPTNDHADTLSAIGRLHAAGGTSLGQAILASLSAIVGQPVNLPKDADADGAPPDLGYWGSATIVVLSDGEDTGGPDAVAAAELAAAAGVHIETIGIGTTTGATITVDGFQVATALNEDLLTQIASATTGSYHRAADAQALDDVTRSLDTRITAKAELTELTGAGIGLAVLLLTIGGLLMITWYGRLL
jgi:Ca-activated chloride channel homolog